MKILPNFDENSDAWDPITELKIPLESHKFDEKDCSLKVCFHTKLRDDDLF